MWLRKPPQYIVSFLLVCWQAGLYAEFSKEQLDWLNSDAEHPAQVVNEGRLTFLSVPAKKAEHHQSMQIQLTGSTIESGWATVNQCHRDLDSVPSLEVVFNRERVRKLQIIRYHNIERAEVEGHRVQVNNIMPGSEICLSAESRILSPVGEVDGHQRFEMMNGPFMRRFLDGYYPITLQLEVEYPGDMLQIAAIEPEAQSGWQIRYDADRITMVGRFEGRLTTRVQFTRLK
jgi:hypothetical protein